MTIVEVVIAIALLLAGTLATARIADATSRASAGSARSETADSLASEAIEELRAAPFAQIGLDPDAEGFVPSDDGGVTVEVAGSRFAVGETEIHDGVAYHLRRHVTWATLSDLGSGAVERAYKAVAVDVEWTERGDVHRVRRSAAVTPTDVIASCAQRWIEPTAVATGPVNGYYPGVGSVASGSTVVGVGDPRDGGDGALSAGDLIIIIQMNGPNAGRYEYAVAASGIHEHLVAVSGEGPGGGLLNSYGPGGFQIVTVPTYQSVELASSFTGLAWDGSTGGVTAVDSVGDLTFTDKVDLSGRGLLAAWPNGFVATPSSLLPGSGTEGAAGGPLVMVRAGNVGAGMIGASGGSDGSGGGGVVGSERGDLSGVRVDVDGGGGPGAVIASSPPGDVSPPTATTAIADLGDLPGVGLGVGCRPVVDTWVTSQTKSVPSDGAGSAVMAIEVRSNAQRLVDASLEITSALPEGFHFALTQEVTLTGGATRRHPAESAPGTSTPRWGGFDLPPGSSVRIEFVATVDPATAAGRVGFAATAEVRSPGGASTSTYADGFSADDDVEVTAP